MCRREKNVAKQLLLFEMKLGRDVYGERLHLPTTFEPDSIRTTEVTADSTI